MKKWTSSHLCHSVMSSGLDLCETVHLYSHAFKKVENLLTSNVTFHGLLTTQSYIFCYPLQNKCVPYWPTLEGESKEVGRYIVTLLAEKDATDYKVRVMELTAPHRVRKQSFQYLCANIHTSTFLCTAPAAQILSLYVILFHCISYHHHQQCGKNSKNL